MDPRVALKEVFFALGACLSLPRVVRMPETGRENDKKIVVSNTQNTISFGFHRGFPSSPMLSTGVHILAMRQGMIHVVIPRRACSSRTYTFPSTPLLASSLVPTARAARFGTLRPDCPAVIRASAVTVKLPTAQWTTVLSVASARRVSARVDKWRAFPPLAMACSPCGSMRNATTDGAQDLVYLI